jgi:predicted DNA-binding protein
MAKKPTKATTFTSTPEFADAVTELARSMNKTTSEFVREVMESIMNDPEAYALHVVAKESPQTSGRYGFIRAMIALAKRYSGVLADDEKDAIRTLVDIAGKNLSKQIAKAVQPENTTV